VIFTSVNGVRFSSSGCAPRSGRARIGTRTVRCDRPRTAERWRGRIQGGRGPDEYQAEGVLEAFKKEDVKGVRILIPRAKWRGTPAGELRAREPT